MPIPALPLLIAGIGAVAALALSGKKKGAPTSGTYTLDANLSPAETKQVLGAIATSKDPSELNQYATEMDAQHHPLAANALRMRAAMLTPGAALPDAQGLDGNMDPATKTAVLHALATETDPNKLMTFAGTIQLQYPIAAGLLVAKADALGGGTPTQAPQPGIPVANPADVAQQAQQAVQQATQQAQQTIAQLPAAPAPSTAIPPSLLAQVNAALTSSDGNALDAAAQALMGSPVANGPQAQAALAALQLAAAKLQTVGLPGASTLDNVLPPAKQPMPAPNAINGVPPAPPPDGTVWVLATNADVARDGVASRYQALLSSQAVGFESHETWNGHLWKFRVLSHTTDPGLTSYAKDVKGWVAQPQSVLAPSAPAAPPTQAPAIIPPAPAPPAAPSTIQGPSTTIQLSRVQQAALAMRNALVAHSYKQADQPFYVAFQAAAGISPTDGFPGAGGTMPVLDKVLATFGATLPAGFPRYPWHSRTPSGATGPAAYDGVNAPRWADWTSAVVATSGRRQFVTRMMA
jgi:hypothetical protein